MPGKHTLSVSAIERLVGSAEARIAPGRFRTASEEVVRAARRLIGEGEHRPEAARLAGPAAAGRGKRRSPARGG